MPRKALTANAVIANGLFVALHWSVSRQAIASPSGGYYYHDSRMLMMFEIRNPKRDPLQWLVSVPLVFQIDQTNVRRSNEANNKKK